MAGAVQKLESAGQLGARKPEPGLAKAELHKRLRQQQDSWSTAAELLALALTFDVTDSEGDSGTAFEKD